MTAIEYAPLEVDNHQNATLLYLEGSLYSPGIGHMYIRNRAVHDMARLQGTKQVGKLSCSVCTVADEQQQP